MEEGRGVLESLLKLDWNFDSSSGFPDEENIEPVGVDRDETEMTDCDELPLVERDEDKEDESVDEPYFDTVGDVGGDFDSSTNSGEPVSSSR